MSSESQTLNLREWFDPSELDLCPDCGARELVPESPGALIRLCLNCGVVPKPIGLRGPTVEGHDPNAAGVG